MYPQQKFDKPGKSPFMDMQLVPKYADEAAEDGGVTISPRVAQKLAVRVVEAKSETLARRLEAVVRSPSMSAVVLVQTRSAGFVERLYARAPFDAVKKGAPLVELLIPEWVGAQAEYLAVRKLAGPDIEPLKQAARQRLLLLGMREEQVAAVERDERVQPRLTLRAPIGGVIAELGVREGMTVSAGVTPFKLVDLATEWVNADVPRCRRECSETGVRRGARAGVSGREVRRQSRRHLARA